MRSAAFVGRLALKVGDTIARIRLFNTSNQFVLWDLLSLFLDSAGSVEKKDIGDVGSTVDFC